MKIFTTQSIVNRSLLVLGLVGMLALAGWWALGTLSHKGPLLNVTVALPTQVCTGAFYVGQDQKVFEKHGLNMVVQPFALGKDALQSVLQGKADLAVLADTPFMFAVMNGQKIAATTTIFGSRRTMAIVALKDHGILNAEDLRHKTIGTIFGTNAQYFVDTYLLANGVAKSDVTIVNMKADALADALKNGKVDAVTAWHPGLGALQHNLGDRVTTLYGEDIFVYRFILVGTQDYLAKHPAEIRQVLAALNESTSYIHNQPSQAKALIGRSLGMNADSLKTAFDPKDFYLTLDQTLLLALGDETRWAMRQGHIPKGPVPNYLNYIDQEPLKSVLPDAIKIIQ